MSLLRIARLTGRVLAAAALQLGVLSLALTAHADGAATYKASCTSCHGEDGKAQTPVGKAMKAADLTAKSHTAEDVVSSIRQNAKHKSVSGRLSDEELAAVASFVAGLGSS